MIESCPKNELKILQEGKFSEVDKSDPEKAINILQDRIRFLEEIINNVNATIYINDILKPESVWANKMAFAMFGATISEMNEGSLSWYKKHYHPDDFEIIAHSTDSLQQDSADQYNGIYRTRKSPEDIWHTHFGSGKIFRKNQQGHNWLVLALSIDVTGQIDNQKQLEAILKENLRLCNQMKIQALTKREKQVLRLIGQGRTIKAIADEFILSPHTVDTHRKNLSKKLNVKNMAGLAAFAVENGLN